MANSEPTQDADLVAALEGFTVDGVGEPLSDEDFVRAYVRRYNWDWCDPIPGLWRGYAIVDADEDDPPIFECDSVEDAQELVRVMRWLRAHFDGDEARYERARKRLADLAPLEDPAPLNDGSDA